MLCRQDRTYLGPNRQTTPSDTTIRPGLRARTGARLLETQEQIFTTIRPYYPPRDANVTASVVVSGERMPLVGEIINKTDEDSRSNRRPIELIGSPAP